MSRRLTLLLFTLPTATAAAAAHTSKYTLIDRCLAQPGMAWNYRTDICETAPLGPVDRIYVDKSEHWMAVYRGTAIVREFRVALGKGGLKPKSRAGDDRVPEGLYAISAHNPSSAYHLSLRISYPSAQDIAAASARGVSAGGDIMIHGLPNGREWVGSRQQSVDWTAGCVALTNAEMDWLYRAVADGTPIEIVA